MPSLSPFAMRPTSALLLVAVLSSAGCGAPQPLYTAQAPTPETVVDGRADEWPQALRPVPREAGLSLGLRRGASGDGADELVVAVIASDERQARRIALGGLRLWIDPEGGQDRVLGVRFPAPEPLGERLLRAQAGPRRDGASDALRRRFQESLASVEVSRAGTQPRRLTAGAVDGLETAASWGPRGLVVEMRVPLTASPALLPTAAGDAVGVGVELVDLQRPPRRQRPARGERPRAASGEAPDTGERAAEPERPPVEVETVTRWLRLE